MGRTAGITSLMALLLIGTTGLPAVAADPGHLYRPDTRWDPTVPGQATTIELEAGNDGGSHLRLLSGSISGRDADEYTVASIGLPRDIVREGSTGSSVGTVTFHPASVGWKEAVVTIVYDPIANDGVDETATFEIPIRALATMAPHGFEFDRESLDGGTVKRRKAATSEFRIHNVSEIPITIEQTRGTTGLTDVAADRACEGVTLAPGDDCRVEVRATSDQIGIHNSRIQVEVSGPFDYQQIRHTFTVIDDPSLPDNVAPRMDPLPPNRAVGVSFKAGARVIVRQSWRGTDDRGVAGYTVKLLPAESDPVTVLDQRAPWPDPLAPIERLDLKIRPGWGYDLSVTVRDREGHTAKARRRDYFTYWLMDLARQPATRSAGWLRATGKDQFMRGDFLRTRRDGASVKADVDADRIYLVARRSARAGVVEVWVDGKKRATFDLQDPAAVGVRPVVLGPVAFPRGDGDPHRVRIVARHKGTRALVEVDSLILERQ